MWQDILGALAANGFSLGEILGIGSVWAAIWRLDRRVKLLEGLVSAIKGTVIPPEAIALERKDT